MQPRPEQAFPVGVRVLARRDPDEVRVHLLQPKAVEVCLLQVRVQDVDAARGDRTMDLLERKRVQSRASVDAFVARECREVSVKIRLAQRDRVVRVGEAIAAPDLLAHHALGAATGGAGKQGEDARAFRVHVRIPPGRYIVVSTR